MNRTLIGRGSQRCLLAVAEPEASVPSVLVLRVSPVMAVCAGRSVVFVTGNAKKLEEVNVTNGANGRSSLYKQVQMGFLLIYFQAFRLFQSVR